jgi:hypothetical protein
MLEHLVVVAFFQLSGPSAPPEAPQTKESELVCTMEPVTGTRARKQRICKPKGGFANGSDVAKEILSDIHRRGGNTSAPPGG